MLKISNFEVLGWEHAIRGMRNPMNSWEKSDSCTQGYVWCNEFCGHREVCSLKTEFLEAQKAIDEVYVSRPCEDGKKVSMIRVRDIKHIEPVELRCKHYIPNTGVNIR